MSDRNENVRLRIEAISELPTVALQYRELIDLQRSMLNVAAQSQAVAAANSASEIKAINAVTAALKEQQSQHKKTSDDANDSAKKLQNSFDEVGKSVRNFQTLIATAFTLNEIKQFGMDVIDAKTKIDQLKISLDVMLGSKAESAKLYAEMVTLAKQTPFSLEEVAENVVKLKAYNIATNDLIPTITSLGNIAAAVGKEKLPQLTLAYGQVMNFGKLMGTELRQFTEAGVPLFDLLATSMGKTRAEVIKLSEEHKIMASDVRKAIMDASEAGGKYYNLMALQAKTLGGEVSNLGDTFFVAKGRVGDFFEKELKSGIRTLAEFMTATVGSNSAINRTIDIVLAAGSAFLTLSVATRAQAVASTALMAVETTKNVLYGAYLILMQRLTQEQIVYTASQTAATAAARGFGAALAANPIGAIITAVGLLTTAYYTYKAATDEVTTALGEQELQLKTEQAELNALTQAAMDAAIGTKQRTDSINLLIQKYPQYFQGIDAEKVSNNQLKNILDTVNGSYRTRIELARQAYNLEGLATQQKELFEKEQAFFSGLPKEISVQFGGDIQKFVAALENGGIVAAKLKRQLEDTATGGAAFFGAAAKSIVGEFQDVEKKYTAGNASMQKSDDDRVAAAIKAENARHEAALAGMKKGSAALAAEQKLHNDNIAKINGTFREAELKNDDDHAEKTKQITLLSQKQQAVILKEGYQETYAQKLAYLDAAEKEERDAATKAVVSVKITAAERKVLEEKAAAEILLIHQKYTAERMKLAEQERELFSRSIDVDISAIQKRTDKEVTSLNTRAQGIKAVAKDYEETEKRIQQLREETSKVVQETIELEFKSRKEVFSIAMDMLSRQGGLIGQASGGIKAAFENFNQLAAMGSLISQKTVDDARTNLDLVKALHEDGNKRTTEQVAVAEKVLADLEKKKAGQDVQTREMATNLVNLLIQVSTMLFTTLNKMHEDTYRAISSAMESAIDINREFYDMTIEMERDAFDRTLEDFKGNYKERERIVEDFFDRQRELVDSRDTMEMLLGQTLSYSNALLEAGRDTGFTHKKYKEAMAQAEIQIEKDKFLMLQQMIINQAEIDREEAEVTRDLKLQALQDGLDAFRDATDQEIDMLRDKADVAEDLINQEKDAKIDGLKAQLDAAKESYQKETDAVKEAYDTQIEALRQKQSDEETALRATYDLKRQLLDQATSDEIEAIVVVDRLRNEAVERYRVDEVARITATRDRILATLTDETERAAVITEFDRQLKNLHDEVEQAKLDKSKGVSIATKQLNKENKENAEQLKQEEKTTIEQLEDDYTTKFKKLADDRDQKLDELKNQQVTRENELKDQIKKIEETSKAEIEKIRKDLKNETTRLQNEIEQKEREVAYNKSIANAEYAVAVNASNRAIFEANKRMKIAELQAEIAVLNSKKNGFNNGKIIEAVGQIEGAIAQINSLDYSSGPIVTPGGNAPLPQSYVLDGAEKDKPYSGNYPYFDKSGNRVEISYTPKNKIITVYDADAKQVQIMNADGYVPATGERFFKGTPYVDLTGKYRNGVDTVPAWLTRGERVMTVDENKDMAGLENKEVVERVKFYDRLSAAFPQMLDPTRWSDIANSSIRLPDYVMNSQGGTSIDLTEVNRRLDQLNQTIKNKKETSLLIDQQGWRVGERTAHSKTTHYDHLINR